MPQVTSGIRSILSRPIVYDGLQNLMGARRNMRILADRLICAKSGDYVLDIGCGTARMLEFLPPLNYWGYDISSEYITAARERFGDRGQFFCKPFERTELAQLPRFNIVLASGLLHHLDDCAASDLISLAAKALKPDGRFISIDPCFVPDQNPIARWLIASDRGQNVRDEVGYRQLATGAFHDIQGTVHHRLWIPYTQWIMDCRVARNPPL